MRITDGMISRNLLSTINSSRQSMNVYQNQIASGKKISKVSDNPVDYTKIETFKKIINQNDQYLTGIDLAKGWIDNTSTALEQINEGLLTAKELAIRAADISNNADNLETFKNQIEDIIEDTISLTNSTFMGKSIFAGTKSTTKNAFLYNGTSVTYTGNDKQINRKIADNYYVDTNVSGREILETNIFDSLINFKKALETGDIPNITNSIDNLNNASVEITKLNSSIGSVKMQIENTQNRIETSTLNLKSYLSNVEDADMAEAITNYKSEETAYQAALSSAASAINLNILSFLR